MADRQVTIDVVLRDLVSSPANIVQKSFKKVGEEVQKLGQLTAPLQRLTALTTGLVTVLSGRGALTAARREVEANQSLLAALRGRILAQETIARTAREIQAITVEGDETLKAQAALLLQMGVNASLIPRALQVAVDTAAALQTPIESVNRSLARALGTGQAGELGERVPGLVAELAKIRAEGRDLTDVLGFLEKRFKGTAQTFAQTTFGQIDQRLNQIGDQGERVGNILARLQLQVLNGILPVVETIADFLEKPAVQGIVDLLGRALPLLVGIGAVLGGIATGLLAFQQFLVALPGLIALVGIAAALAPVATILFIIVGLGTGLFALILRLTDQVGNFKGAIGDWLGVLKDAAGELGRLLRLVAEGRITFRDFLEVLQARLPSFGELFALIYSFLQRTQARALRLLIDIARSGTTAVFNVVAEGITRLGEFLIDVFRESFRKLGVDFDRFMSLAVKAAGTFLPIGIPQPPSVAQGLGPAPKADLGALLEAAKKQLEVPESTKSSLRDFVEGTIDDVRRLAVEFRKLGEQGSTQLAEAVERGTERIIAAKREELDAEREKQRRILDEAQAAQEEAVRRARATTQLANLDQLIQLGPTAVLELVQSVSDDLRPGIVEAITSAIDEGLRTAKLSPEAAANLRKTLAVDIAQDSTLQARQEAERAKERIDEAQKELDLARERTKTARDLLDLLGLQQARAEGAVEAEKLGLDRAKEQGATFQELEQRRLRILALTREEQNVRAQSERQAKDAVTAAQQETEAVAALLEARTNLSNAEQRALKSQLDTQKGRQEFDAARLAIADQLIAKLTAEKSAADELGSALSEGVKAGTTDAGTAAAELERTLTKVRESAERTEEQIVSLLTDPRLGPALVADLGRLLDQIRALGTTSATIDIGKAIAEGLSAARERLTRLREELAARVRIGDLTQGQALDEEERAIDELRQRVERARVTLQTLAEQGPDVAEGLKPARLEIEALARELGRLDTTAGLARFGSGLREGARQITAEFRDLRDVGVAVGRSLTDNLGNAVSEIWITGAKNVREWAASVLSALAQIVARAATLRFLDQLFSAFGTGITLSGGLPGGGGGTSSVNAPFPGTALGGRITLQGPVRRMAHGGVAGGRAAIQGAARAVTGAARAAAILAALSLAAVAATPSGIRWADQGAQSRAFAQHAGAQGATNKILRYDRGGGVPGPNVHADIVHALLMPGEFVQTKDASRHYTYEVMELLRRKLIPREVFAPFLRGSPPQRTLDKVRLQTGGTVLESAAPSRGSGRPGVALVEATEQSFRRQLDAGGPALLRWLAGHGFHPSPGA